MGGIGHLGIIGGRPQLPTGLDDGIKLFNSGHYWEAHEAWEGAWMPRRGTADADFFKGLVQVAAGCYHYQRRNRHGAEVKWRDGAAFLRPYLPEKEGLDLQALVASVDGLLRGLQDTDGWPDLAMPSLSAEA